MSYHIKQAIEIKAPVAPVYRQWTCYEEFPNFLSMVSDVRQVDPETLFWQIKLLGVKYEWESKIANEVPNKLITWKSVKGVSGSGCIKFRSLAKKHTRIELEIEVELEGLSEKAARNLLRLAEQLAKEDLKRFKRMLEQELN